MNHKETPEKPILMSAPMVKAILANLKTQTRRTTGLKKINEDPNRYLFHKIEGGVAIFYDGKKGESFSVKLPYGLPGWFLWVRESWRTLKSLDHVRPRDLYPGTPVHYIVDDQPEFHSLDYGKNRPSIFLSRAFSRINLIQEKVRVERLHDISEDDCCKEGLKRCPDICGLNCNGCDSDDPRQWFKQLWESINGPGSWAANPWLWVVEFKKAST